MKQKLLDALKRFVSRCSQIITFAENLDWAKLWWLTGVLFALWLGLIEVLPMTVYKPVSVILMALQSAFLFAAKSSKYVKERELPPDAGNK